MDERGQRRGTHDDPDNVLILTSRSRSTSLSLLTEK